MDKDIKVAGKKLQYLSGDEKTVALYEAKENSRIEYNSKISSAIEKGIEKEKVEVAKKLLLNGSDFDFVSKITGLSMDEVSKIKDEL